MESKVHRTYDLNGLTLAITGVEEKPATFLDPMLASLRCSVPAVGDWTASLSPVAAIEAPTGGDRIFEGPLPEGLPSVMVKDGNDRVLTAPGHFVMGLRRSARTTDIRFVPGKERSLSGTAAFWMLDDILAANRRQLLHGALLVDPVTDRSIVLFAPSGTGKTTTALALARAGLHLAGDDALVLDARNDRCSLWAIPRKLKAHRKTALLLPWLGPTLTGTWIDDEQALELGALSPLVLSSTPKSRPAELVIALLPPNENGHEVTAINRPDALTAIACDNLRVAPGGVDADDAAALSALAKLVASTRVIALSVGPDPASLSPALVGLA